MLKQTDNPNFVKDMNTRALLNTNKGELDMLKGQRNRITNDKEEVENLRNQVEELKSMLLNILQKDKVD